ncbi:hypothetical protein AC578_9194 [Pseudocercospora eumusae]|uniref:C2H2-type domain-containing protein n=1 Tax=Pseudocercospora eumusae TaxID=321146 RepID=A0A139HV72_9PEZI|nr:hypothetical protein AC578_9194 [Pseudocercospora eumusae]
MASDSDSDPYPEDESLDEEEESSEIDHEDHQEVREVSSPIPTNTTLEDAITTAPEVRLRALLRDIVQRVPEAHAIAARTLLASTSTAGVKRKAFEKCKNCGDDYNVSLNYKGACVYHEGVKELDNMGDFWADHDPNCHGDPGSFVDDPDMEEGFVWSCCEQTGGADGCVISKHQPRETHIAKRPILTPVSRNAVGRRSILH